MAQKKSNRYGIASLVLGIISIISVLIPVISVILGILGIVFYNKQKKNFPNGISTAGLVTSIIGISLSALQVVVTAIFLILLI